MFTLMIMYVVSGLVLSGLALPLMAGKIAPNGMYGFRVKATLENPQVWYAVNKYAGLRLLVAGILTILSAVGFYFIPGLSLDTYALACLGVFAIVLIFGLVQSVIYLRSLKLREH